jgi:hypothetical protein
LGWTGTRDAFVAKIVIIPDVLKLIGFETADLSEIPTPGSGVAVKPIGHRITFRDRIQTPIGSIAGPRMRTVRA